MSRRGPLPDGDVVAPPPPPLSAAMRTRFAPAPSGDLHVGNVRTALYNWALARRHGGAFVLRVEDTDASRVSEDSVSAIEEMLGWIGIDWDEGPYRQSQRGELYRAAAARLESEGFAYRCYCTPEELAERRQAAHAAGRPPGYDGRCRTLTDAERAGYAAVGRSWVLRLRVPAGSTTWADLVRGVVTIRHDQIPDFALTRSGGAPLYLLAAAVDDLAMGITHVVRGEDLTTATPRQMLLYTALGHPPEGWPAFGHLPMIVGDDGRPLSKRNGEVSLAAYRAAGFLPEVMLNYLAIVGWSMPGGADRFSAAEFVAHFSLDRVSRNPARFDVRKLEALNGEAVRALTDAELAGAVRAALSAAGLPAPGDIVAAALPLVRTRMNRLSEAVRLLGFLVRPEEEFGIDSAAAAKVLTAGTAEQLGRAAEALATVEPWTTERIAVALDAALVAGLGLSRRAAYTPVRVAVTGGTVSPPLPESLELLGRERTLARLHRAAALARATGAPGGEGPDC